MDTRKNYWKRLEELVTGLGRNRFSLARIKLTAFYSLILAVIMTALSVAVYRSTLINVALDLRSEFLDPVLAHAALVKFSSDLETDIIIIDAAFIALMTTLSYVFAGEILRPLRESIEEQKRFTADVAHELRTPLAVMRADLEIAEASESLDRKETERLIKSNLEEVEQLTELAGSLLILLKEDNAGSNDMKKVDLYSLTGKAVGQLRVLAEARGLSMEMAEGTPVFTVGHPDSLNIMIRNLIKNAIQYTPEGGAVTVSVGEENKKAVLRVRDTGIGIGEADLPHVFDRFYKADKSRTQSEGGAGLGLSIVDRIVRNHNGQIKIESVLGKGTEAAVSLSLA
ncbi:MAG: HAMP domain-containing histidine kinase [Patescibacteria group bacterium]|nr:HAMP domain-containing histidine kinase [Patescibacteria group bacterium]